MAESNNGAAMNGSTRMIVVSGDSHIGPRLREDLRPYCPQKYLDEFDRFIEANVDTMDSDREDDILTGRSTSASEVSITRQLLNRQTAGHYDVHTRLREMDWDGVAAEVILHGSQNTQVYPFSGRREWAEPDTTRNLELVAVGHRIYNSFMADFVSVAPDRLIALAYLPMWDVDLAVKELEFCAARGIRAVNFPAPRAGIAEYDDPGWEPLWAACEEHKMNLVTHVGLPGNNVFGPQRMAMTRLEHGGWPARRGMVRMIFGGVFERHPGLKLILTEVSRGWWRPTMRELNFVYSSPSDALHAQVPNKPSEYMKSNVFIGASFMPPSEVREAIEDGYADQVIWGRDYPHGEGTYKYPESDGEESQTKHYLRWAFAGCPLEIATKMLSDTAIHAYDLNREALAKVAAQIGPTVDDVTAPWDQVPAEWANNLVDVQTGEVADGFVAIRQR